MVLLNLLNATNDLAWIALFTSPQQLPHEACTIQYMTVPASQYGGEKRARTHTDTHMHKRQTRNVIEKVTGEAEGGGDNDADGER